MFANLFSGGISGLLKGAKGLISEFHMDPAEKAELRIKLMEVEHAMDKAQLEVNAIEAKHPDWKVAGWRPFTGWVCGVGLAYQVLLQPLLTWISTMLEVPVPPNVDLAILMPVLMGMLGLGGIRAYEKMKGVARG